MTRDDARHFDQNLSNGTLLALIGALVLGVAAAAAVMPTLFRATPTDISRIGVLLSALRQPNLSPEVAVLGNSVVMSAVDGHQLSAALPGAPVVLNLASTGQSLVESYLLQQEFPDSVDTVVQLVTPSGSEREERPLEPQKYNTFYMYGFRPSRHVVDTLGQIFGPSLADILTASDLSQRFQARWAVRQFVDTQMRMFLRSDLTLADAERDLFHPQRYTAPVGARRLQRSIEGAVARLAGSISVRESTWRLIEQMIEDSWSRHRLFVALLPPVHPQVLGAVGGQLVPALHRFQARLSEQKGVVVVDATDALDSEHFVDALHPTNSGAEIVTDLLAQRIAAAR
jgi:hypothetical protein